MIDATDLDFRVSWRDNGAANGLKALAQHTKDTRVSYQQLQATAETAGRTLKRAQDASAAAARKVAIEEAKLKELRDSGKAKLSQTLAAEDRLASARRKASDATDDVEKATKDYERAQDKANRATKESAEAQQKADRASSRWSRSLGALSNGAGQVGGKIGSLAKTVGKVGVAAGVAAGVGGLYALSKGLGGSVEKAATFDKGMRTVGVTLGVTGDGLKDLTNLAQKMGAETSFSAQGASDAMLALAKGGLTSAEMKAGALKETLTLATAGGLELGNAADYVVQGLSAFGLKANEASRVTTALAGGANASTASVESMGLALSQVGAGAKIAGLSIEDTTAALAAFDNAGVKGSDAGTSLKTFLTRLVPSTEKATNAMMDLGLITLNTQKAQELLRSKGIKPLSNDQDDLTLQLQQYAMKLAGTSTFTGKAVRVWKQLRDENDLLSNGFFDAKGNIKSMADVAGLLSHALKDQTKEQKIATLSTIFGSDASRAAGILADQGAKGLEKFMKATRDKSAADKLAKSATEGYSGALERFQGAVETAQIKFGTKLLPVLTKGMDLLSGRFLPAVDRLGSAVGPIFGSMAHLGAGAFDAIFKGADKSKSGFQTLVDYISTHQEDITGTLISGARAALSLGKTLAQSSSTGLRALASLSDATVGMSTIMLAAFSAILHGAAETWGFIPGIGDDLRKADKAFAGFAKGAVAGMRVVGPGARAAADAIDKNVIPAIDKAQGGLDKLSKTEISNARQRDTAARVAQAIETIGTKTDGSQIKLKKFADVTGLAVWEQQALRVRLSDASTGLYKQLQAMQSAHAGQEKLTKAWETGRDRLYKEFRQMGLSKDEAKKLAAQYAGIPPKVQTKVTQPGMRDARVQVEGLDQDINKLNNKKVLLSILTSSNYKEVKKKFDLTFPQSRADGGPIQNVSGRGVKGKDTEPVMAAVGEHMWTSGEVDAVGGHSAMYRMRSDARAGKFRGYAGGGEILRRLTVATSDRLQGSLPADSGNAAMARRTGDYMGEAMSLGFQKRFNTWAKKHADGGLGDPANVSNPRGVTSYHGGRFTRLFVANLKAAERDAGRAFTIYQGGFRPTTSYSGSTHNMDAIDAHVNYTLLRAYRRRVGAMGDRTGLGNWAAHMHGVPAPGHGYGSPSARAQYRDYVRRGGASQSPRSPWGLDRGGLQVDPSTVNVSERGPERVLTTRQTASFERLVHALDKSGGSVVINFHAHAPNYVGTPADLVRALMKAEQGGQLDALKRRFK